MRLKHAAAYFTSMVVVTLVVQPVTWAHPQIDAGQLYLLLAAERTSTMQDELNEVAAQGFRIITGSPTSGNEMAIFLERSAEPPDTYEYQEFSSAHRGRQRSMSTDCSPRPEPPHCRLRCKVLSVRASSLRPS